MPETNAKEHGMHRGKLIVIEGADSSGKATQTKLLFERLHQRVSVTQFAFPRYETETGLFVRRCLNGDFGDFLGMSPYLASLPYILDFVHARDELSDALLRGHVLSDRYTPSNLAHQGAKISDPEARASFIEWFEEQIYTIHGIPKPDCVIYLLVPTSVSWKLMEGRGGKKDQHEADRHYQARVVDRYLELSSARPDWHTVECAPGGTMLPPDTIREKVWTIVRPLLNQ